MDEAEETKESEPPSQPQLDSTSNEGSEGEPESPGIPTTPEPPSPLLRKPLVPKHLQGTGVYHLGKSVHYETPEIECDSRWTIPDEEDNSCEDGCNMCCRIACLPWVGSYQRQTSGTSPDQAIKMVTSKVADRMYLRGFCVSMRKTTLKALRNLVDLDWLLAHHLPRSGNTSERVVPDRFLDALFDQVVFVIEEQLAVADALLMATAELFAWRVQEFLQLDLLRGVRINLNSLFASKTPIKYSDWYKASHLAKNSLRYISDRMALALNEATIWKIMYRYFNCFGCLKLREPVELQVLHSENPMP